MKKNNPLTPVKCGILHRPVVDYSRVSTKMAKEEGYSIPSQQKLCRSYADNNRFSIVREFIDVETAKREGRKDFSRMLQFLRDEAKKPPEVACRTILVEKTDRLYRNIKDWVTLDELGVEIHFVKEGVILSPESNSKEKFMHGIMVLMAKAYIDNLSEETRKGMVEKAEEGIFPSYAPLGFINIECNGKRIIQPDPDVAPLIKKLFGWYITGNFSLLAVTQKIREEGLVYRKTGSKIHKSLVHKILGNPIYAGDFIWGGKLYRGTHEPIVSREMFDRVQEIMNEKGKRRTRQQKHSWAFQGLASCGHCGCALTAEGKKGRYVYYHCTGHRGKCPEKYIREEEMDRQFVGALAAIRMDEDVLDWVVTALKESHADEKRFHDERIGSLQREYTKYQNRLDAMYVDKLDGRISQEIFDGKSAEWRKEQNDLLRKIANHQSANRSYLDDGVRILELSQHAVTIYEKQEMREKRRLLDFVFSNSTWKDGTLTPNYRKPFDMIAVTNISYKKEQAASPGKSGLNEIWLPGQDSNLQPSG